MNSEKQIHLFLDGNLKGQELEIFRRRLSEDESFNRLFMDYKKVWDLIVSQHRKMTKMVRLKERVRISRNAISPEDLLGELEAFMRENYPLIAEEEKFKQVLQLYFNRKVRKNRRIGFIIALAAGILLLIGIPLTLMKHHELKNNSQLFDEYFSTYPYFLHERSLNNSDSSLNAKAMFLYNNQEYSEAAVILSKLVPDSISDPLHSLYLGICYMKMKQYSIAINTFESIVSLHQHLTYDQANWYLGLTFLKIDKKFDASECLLRVKSDSGQFAKQANEILKKISQN